MAGRVFRARVWLAGAAAVSAAAWRGAAASVAAAAPSRADECGDVSLLQRPAPHLAPEEGISLVSTGHGLGHTTVVGDRKTPPGAGSTMELSLLKGVHDSACSTVFLTDVLNTRKDPQRKIWGTPGFEYFERYYRSILAMPGARAKAVILHDFLSDEFTNAYSTQDGTITFVKVNISGMDPQMGLNDLRYQLFVDQVKAHPEWDTVFMTDISDVVVVNNPCLLVEKEPEKLFVGSQRAWMKPYKYIHEKFEQMGGKYLDWYDAAQNDTYKLLNAGILGGKRPLILEALDKLNTVLVDPELTTRKNGSEVTVNMPAFNYVFHKELGKEIVTGSPLHSKFWSYENRTDVFFWHK